MRTFFRPEMCLPEHTHPGPQKARDLMKLSVGAVDHTVNGFFERAELPQLSLVHNAAYVQGVLAGDRPNGFGSFDPAVADQAAWCSGAAYAAARWLAEAGDPRRCAFVPASGFHHAGWASGGGYCTFNGLVLAAVKFQRARAGGVRSVLILDGDAHYGNGTAEILGHLLKTPKIAHITNEYSSDKKVDADACLKAIRSSQWGCILYQAGADAWAGDTYGAGYLTEEQMLERDVAVFEEARRLRIPVLWCLAGGYSGEKTLALHLATMKAAAQIFVD
jgi:acetoin utilization deacetylase AcuC-like enzyme